MDKEEHTTESTVEKIDSVEPVKNSSNNAKIGIMIGALLLVISVPLTIATVNQRTVSKNNAAGFEPTLPPIAPSQPVLPKQAFTNLNSATDIIATVNTDGTMGPQSSVGNWSNAIPDFLKGKLVFGVIDPPQSGKPSDPGSQGEVQGNRPVDAGNPNLTQPVYPTHTLPTQAQGNNNSYGNQPTDQPSEGQGEQGKDKQTVTALNLTITKVEVHIAYQGTPGDQANAAYATPDLKGSPSASYSQKGQAVDHWETLTLPASVTVDLVQLAKIKAFSQLGLTTLAAGRYTEVRLYVRSATATLANGSTVGLNILGRDNIVKVVQPFTIVAGQTTKLTMDFDAQNSVVQANGQYNLKPVIARLIEEH